MTTNRLVDEILLRGSDDWLMLAEVASLAKHVGGASSDEEVRVMSLSTIRFLLDEGLIRVGDVSDGGFFEWPVKREEAMARLEREWGALGHVPEPGDLCWVATTDAGDAWRGGASDHPGADE